MQQVRNRSTTSVFRSRVARWATRLSAFSNRLWLLLPLLVLPAMWPYISRGWPNSADGTLHLLRLVLLDHHISEGFLYPRWVPELMLGNGYPVFNFYAPATYYVAEIMNLLGMGYYGALMVSSAIFVGVAGIGAYRLALDLFGRNQHGAAFVAGVAYMYAPYLLSNVFIRGAIAEVGAQALLPWIFWSIRRLILNERAWQHLLAVALSLGGLALTHNITLLFATPVVLLYTLVIWWQSGRTFSTLLRTGIGFATAMGISAVFWLPLIGERAHLADTAYDVSLLFLPENVWTWSNFVDLHLFFEYTFSPPYQLGWLQLGLAIAGFVLVRRWTHEWIFFGGVVLVLSFAIGEWTLPIWFNVEILQIAQFPWRLLGIVSLPLALFAAALVTRLSIPWLHASGVLLLVLVIVLGQRPQLDWIEILPSNSDAVRLSSVAQFELETGSLGTSSAQEFVPRWVESFYYTPSPTDLPPAQGVNVTVHTADAFEVSASVTSQSDSFLRFATFYFPGWEVRIDGTPQEIYPSTNLGLLTVDLPAGEHEVELVWRGTTLQQWAGTISLVTVLGLALFCWGIGQRRWAIAPALLGSIALAATLYTPAPSTLQAAPQRIDGGGVELVGYSASQEEQFLSIRPYWHVRTTPDPDFRLRWQLQDDNGVVVAALDTRPRYNGMQASNWPAGTLVDDAHEVILPPDLAAGQYQLALQLDSGDTNAPPPVVLGAVTLAATPPPVVSETPAHALRISFGDILSLAGYSVAHQDQAVITDARHPMIVTPGEWVSYTLFWQPLTLVPTNYHGFIHLVDIHGEPLAQKDQLAGSLLHPPLLWDPYNLQADRYALLIPEDAPSKLYWPRFGLYDFATLERLPANDANGNLLPNGPELPPIKVVNKRPSPEPAHALALAVGPIATLLGYNLDLPNTPLRPGDSFTLTLTYKANAVTDIGYTQFIHLYNPQLGMAAQTDRPPADGGNPTWAWVPGEIIVEPIRLTIQPNTPAGEYELLVGLYDPANGARLPLTHGDGAPLPNGQVAVETVTVLSAE